MNINGLCKHIDSQFATARAHHELMQDIADLCYPERGWFTRTISAGSDFAAGIVDSDAQLARQDLGNAIGTMLRQPGRKWFSLKVRGHDDDQLVKQWCERVTGIMLSMMRDSESGFTRATQDADHDYAAFGAACIEISFDPARTRLIFRNWHLSSMAWSEGDDGQINAWYRRWKTSPIIAQEFFKVGLHPQMLEMIDKDPDKEVIIHHVIMPSDRWHKIYGGKKYKASRVSVYIDVERKHVIKVAATNNQYVVPRWSLALGHQYAVSPAATTALADVRTQQEIVRSLLEATEKELNPPMVGRVDAFKGNIEGYAGGVTPVDLSFDEANGPSIARLYGDVPLNIPVGLEMLQYYAEKIHRCFMLNKLAMPSATEAKAMTAYEVGQRVQEYIRGALPIFGPMEDEYNGKICHAVLDLILQYAPDIVQDMPSSIAGGGVQFTFSSPLHDAIDAVLKGQFLEAFGILAQVVQVEPNAVRMLDIPVALRDTLNATVPSKWVVSDQDYKEAVAAEQQKLQAMQSLAGMQQAADVAKTISEAQPALKGAGF